MKNLNFILVEGNLVRDPEFRATDSGMPMCRFTVANNYSFKRNDEWVNDVNFINIVTWSKTAENCGQYLKKGHPVRIKGRIDQSYIKREDGRSINMIDVVAQSVEFLPRSHRETEAETAAQAALAEPAAQSTSATMPDEKVA